MGSFKLEKGGNAKDQARTAGIFAGILGLIVGVLFHPAGFILATLGLVFFIASYGAKQ